MEKIKGKIINIEKPKLMFKGTEINTKELLKELEDIIYSSEFKVEQFEKILRSGAKIVDFPIEIHITMERKKQTNAEFMKYLILKELGEENE